MKSVLIIESVSVCTCSYGELVCSASQCMILSASYCLLSWWSLAIFIRTLFESCFNVAVLYVFRRSGFDCENLMIANCEFF